MSQFSTFRAVLLATTLILSGSAYAANAPHLNEAPWQMITLSAGTQVSLMLNEAIDAESVAIGNSLDFSVRSNVVVNGKVLIAAGSTATGWVKSIKKTCGGKCAEVTISVESAQAVDGQTVNLRSIPHIVKAPNNGSSTANIGTNLTAHVLNDIKING